MKFKLNFKGKLSIITKTRSQNKGPKKGKALLEKNTHHDNFQVCQKV